MANWRGQFYDVAGNMAGRYNGVSTLIQGQFGKALYINCINIINKIIGNHSCHLL